MLASIQIQAKPGKVRQFSGERSEMKQLLAALGLNILGLAVTAWGVGMLVNFYPPLIGVAEGALVAVGLAVSGITVLWLLALSVERLLRERSDSKPVELPEESPAAILLPNSAQLFLAIKGLTNDTIGLIEKRREIHYLNMQQWHRDHRAETAAEIEATKRFRGSKNSLDLERLAAPTPFWPTVDNFRALVDRSLSDEVYSAPGDRIVHDAINRYSKHTIQQLQDISSGVMV
jgi:hypothetical protein